MELGAIVAEFRRRADDRVELYQFPFEDLALFASEAEEEACVRARLLFDDTTAEVTQYAVTANTPVIEISPLIDVITAASFTNASGGRPRNLDLKGLDWVHDQCDWQGRTSSRPGYLVHLRKQVRIWPTPSMAGTLSLAVYRLPLYPMEEEDDEPEIDADLHMGLVDWMLYRAHTPKDGEQEDTQRAANALAAFEERFGERPAADVRRRHRERRRVTTRCR